jgi:hypothetical protein
MHTDKNKLTILVFIGVDLRSSAANSVFAFSRRAGHGGRKRRVEFGAGAVGRFMGHGWTRMHTDKNTLRILVFYRRSSAFIGG